MFFVHFCGSSPERHQFVRSRFLRLVLSVLGFFRCRGSRSFCLLLLLLFLLFLVFFVLVVVLPVGRCVVFGPARFAARPSFLAVCRGCVFLPPCVFGILGTCRVFGPLILFLGRWAAGCSVFLLLSFLFSPCLLFCGVTPVSRRTGGGLIDPAGSLTHPSEE